MIHAAFAAGVAAMLVAASGNGLSAGTGTRNYLTFSRPTTILGTVLPAGRYTFEVVTPDTSANLVRVTGADHRVQFTGYTLRVRRPATVPRDQLLVFGEAKSGEPVPIKIWYPIGETFGHEFLR
jgi:hypothetical protein